MQSLKRCACIWPMWFAPRLRTAPCRPFGGTSVRATGCRVFDRFSARPRPSRQRDERKHQHDRLHISLQVGFGHTRVNTDAHALVLRNFRDAGGKNLMSRGEFAVHSNQHIARSTSLPPREALPRSHHATAVGTRKYVATRARQGWAPCAREWLACVVNIRFAISAPHRPRSPAACGRGCSARISTHDPDEIGDRAGANGLLSTTEPGATVKARG